MTLVPIRDIKIGGRFRKDLGDIKELAKSIEKNGLLEPVVLSEEVELICGIRRIEACKLLGRTEIECVILRGPFDQKDAEVDENNIRKNFTIEEISKIDEFYKDREEAEARQRQLEGKPLLNFNKGRSAGRIGKRLGKSYVQIMKIHEVKAAYIENPTLYKPIWDKAIRTNKIDKAFNKVKQISRLDEARKRALATISPSKKYKSFELILGDMREKGREIPDESIPLIVTDPPYAKDFLYLCDELCALAQRVLKPGGSLVTIAPNPGESYLYYIDTIMTAGLKFHHHVALIHGGSSARMPKGPEPAIIVKQKPMLWWFKPGSNNARPTQYIDIENIVYSQPVSKEFHEWEQSPIEAEHFIRALTVEPETVLDAFCGSGAFLEGALKLGRKGIGIESDPFHHSNAVNRLNQLSEKLRLK